MGESPEHIQGHRENKGSKPEYIVSVNVGMYEVKTSRRGPGCHAKPFVTLTKKTASEGSGFFVF